jgi:hypothetical protein
MAFVGANLPNDLGVRFAKRKASSGLEKTQLVIIALERLFDSCDDRQLIAEYSAWLEKQAARRAARGGKKNSTKVAA